MRKVFLAIAVALAVAACGGGSKVASTPTTSSTSASPPHASTTAKRPARKRGTNNHGYPHSVVNKFMASCLKKAKRADCKCVLDYVESDHPYKQLKAASLKQAYEWELVAARTCATI